LLVEVVVAVEAHTGFPVAVVEQAVSVQVQAYL